MERARTEIDGTLLDAVRELAEEQGRDERETIEALLGEAIKMRRFPGITFRGPEQDRRASVAGTGLDVWEVIEMYRDMGRELLLESSNLSERRLDLALAYYREHPEEVDGAIKENRQPPEYWRRRYPSVIPPPPE